jgi:hypothetical protein
LGAFGRGTPNGDAIVVVLSGEHCGEAAPDEPRRLAVAYLLGDFRESEADCAEAVERLHSVNSDS